MKRLVSLIGAIALVAAPAALTSARADSLPWTEDFESYAVGALDKNLSGGPNSAPNGSGNPWFGPNPANMRVVGAEYGITPHSGSQMIRGILGGFIYGSDKDWDFVNLAYRFGGGLPLPGNFTVTWWFYDQAGPDAGDYCRDYLAVSNYGWTGSATYDFQPDPLTNTNTPAALQRLSLGMAENTATGYDRTKYQARVVNDPGGYTVGWYNLNLTRSIGWHRGRIEVGPALPDLSNEIKFYIDDMYTPLLTKNSVTKIGYDCIQVLGDWAPNGFSAYFDDISIVSGLAPVDTGACCSGGTCTITTKSECEVSGGVYQGDLSVCSPTPQITCQPVGVIACPDGTATFMVTATGPNLSYQWKMADGPTGPWANIPGATSATYNRPALSNGRYFACDVSSNCGTPNTVTSAAVTLNVIGSITVSGTGAPYPEGRVPYGTAVTLSGFGGFNATYWNYQAQSRPPWLPSDAVLALQRLDPLIDFDWGAGSPNPCTGIGCVDTDGFMGEWVGSVVAPVTGDYIFTTISDDGSRLWVDDVMVVNKWVDQGPTPTNSAPIALTARQVVKLRMRYYENAVGAAARLHWSAAAAGLPEEPVHTHLSWLRDGVPVPNVTGTLTIPSFGGANVGTYVCQLEGCPALQAAPVTLQMSADFDSSGAVNVTDVELFIGCCTGSGIPYGTLAAPCVPSMDQDGDGDIDVDDFGLAQLQYGL